jgi:hypothetical protein
MFLSYMNYGPIILIVMFGPNNLVIHFNYEIVNLGRKIHNAHIIRSLKLLTFVRQSLLQKWGVVQ